MALATIAQVEALLGEDLPDGGPEETRVLELIGLAQQSIEGELGRPAEAEAGIVELVTIDPWVTTVLLDRWPVAAVGEVQEAGEALATSAWSVDLDTGQITRLISDGKSRTYWLAGVDNVQVTYDSETIGQLSTLCAQMAARAYRAGLAAANAKAANIVGLRQLTIGRWSATSDSSDDSDPVKAMTLTDLDKATIFRFRDRGC